MGRYVVVGCVGEGGMGVVYAAHDFALDRRVSLKLVRSGQGTEAELRRARLLSEAQALARVAHPNVVAVHDVGTFGDEVYVALEHVPGLTLGDWLRSAPRSPRAICEVFAQAGRGLAAVHAAGLVHRDVKPDNVLLGEDGRVRLADFGLAVASGGDGDASAGTPGYMPLEQLRGEPVDARADQFAFAVALYEALTGERPYGPRGASRAALQERLGTGMPADVPRIPGVHSAVRRALARALSPAAADRFPSLANLLEALDRRAPGRLRPQLPLGLSVLGVVFVALLAAAAMPLDHGSLLTVPPRAPDPASRAGLAVLPDRAPAATGREQAAPLPTEPAPAATTSVRPLGGETAVQPSLGRTPVSWGGEGWLRGQAPWSRRPREAGTQLGPVSTAALEALIDSLSGLLKSLRTALETDSHLLWAGGPALAPPTVEGLRTGVPGVVPGTASGGEPVQADGSALRTAAIGQLEQRLEASIAKGVPTDIAEARFALAQALASDPGQHTRALLLAEQAKADLSGDGSPDARTEALRIRLESWIEAHQSFHAPGAGGGNLVTSGAEGDRRLSHP